VSKLPDTAIIGISEDHPIPTPQLVLAVND
jgi:hypothetical protein